MTPGESVPLLAEYLKSGVPGPYIASRSPINAMTRAIINKNNKICHTRKEHFLFKKSQEQRHLLFE